MAPKAILCATTIIAIVIFPATNVNAMPLLDDSSVFRTVEDTATKLDLSLQESSSPRVDAMESSPVALVVPKRSIVVAENEEKILKAGEESNDNNRIISKERNDDNDLETAAGTNVLRPLFVYRQQLAYRERVKKAGRRAAPNF